MGSAAERVVAPSPSEARTAQGGDRGRSEVGTTGSSEDVSGDRGGCFLDDEFLDNEAVPGAFLHHEAPLRIAGPALSQTQELQALAFGAVLACLVLWCLYVLDVF